MDNALAKLVWDDPTLRASTNESNQILLSGMGELHLKQTVEKLERTYGMVLEVGPLRVIYRQSLAKPIDLITRFVTRDSRVPGKFAVINIFYEPLNKEKIRALRHDLPLEQNPTNIFFTNEISHDSLPPEFISAVEIGFRESCQVGDKFKFPVYGLHAHLYGGRYHEIDSSPETFRLTAISSFHEAQLKAGVAALEPVMKVSIKSPANLLADLIGDVNNRRGEVIQSSSNSGLCQLKAYIPLSELFGYAGHLRRFSEGEAILVMKPSHYAPVRDEQIEVRAAC